MSAVRALVVPADPAEPARVVEQAWTLPEMQATVGGWVEGVSGSGGTWWAVVNETGALDGLTVNERATALAVAGGWQPYPPGWSLRGDVVFFGPPDPAGDITSVTAQTLALARSLDLAVQR